jgi:hypothetical protein
MFGMGLVGAAIAPMIPEPFITGVLRRAPIALTIEFDAEKALWVATTLPKTEAISFERVGEAVKICLDEWSLDR